MSAARITLTAGVGLGVVKTAEKVAVTDCIAFIVTTQLPVPLQAPDHVLNDAPAAGLAVSVTMVPLV